MQTSTARHCYVVGCTNGGYKLRKWSSGKCPVHGSYLGDPPCNCPPPFRLFPFPSAKNSRQEREQWLKLMKRANPNNKALLLQPSPDHRVCSDHFVDAKPTRDNPHPTLKLGYSKDERCDVLTPRAKRQQIREEAGSTRKSQEPIEPPQVNVEKKPKQTYTVLHFLVTLLLSLWRKATVEISSMKQEKKLLRAEVAKLQAQVLKLKKVAGEKSTSNDLKTDSDARFLTGLDKVSYFRMLHDKVSTYVRRKWRGAKNNISRGIKRKFIRSPRKFGPKPKLSTYDELLLTLMKLRLGLLNNDLAKRFKISVSLVNQIFNSWLTALSKTFGKIVFWYPKDCVNATLPARFRFLPNLRGIIDCSEIFIETPKNMTLQHVTWSNYKHHNTAKFLICVAPNSMITFISCSYGGRLSDKKIVELTGFLDMCDTGDMIMADKGFNIQEECAVRSIQLYVPPGKRGESQMSIAAVNKTKRIANLRILVEQIIRRLKTFRILKCQLPVSLIPALDKMLNVCGALSNLQPPLYKS